jgi:hypothetical protein
MMEEKIVFWENKILNWMNNRAQIAGESDYITRLLTTSKANPVQNLANEIEAFCSGSFVLDATNSLN